MSHPRVIIAGGSGFLGQALAHHLAPFGYDVTILSRALKAPKQRTRANHRKPAPRRRKLPLHTQPATQHEPGRVNTITWDARTLGPWINHVEGAHALVNLVGRSVDCVKTPDHCDEILRSRVESTRILAHAIAAARTPPPVWVQMSTAHAYGDPPSTVCDEESSFGHGFAPEVARAWERACLEPDLPDTRRVILRTSFVLDREGGAMTRLRRLARLGLGGTISHGRQGISWIHILDMNRLFQRAIEDQATQGAYIATAPNPVSNADFMRALRRTLHVPVGLPAPAFAVRLAAPRLLGTDPDLAIYGRYCVSKRLAREGFDFWFPTIDGALTDLFE